MVNHATVSRMIAIRLFSCLSISLALTSCGPAGPVTGSYSFPTAVIGLSPKSPETATRARAVLVEFAEEHRLHRYRVSEDRDAPEYMRRTSYNLRSTYFNPNPPNTTHGFGLELTEYDARCWVVEFMERSDAWTPESLRAFDELTRRLSGVSEASGTVLVSPKSIQNDAESRERREGDFERERYQGELCARMGVRPPGSPRHSE